MTSDDRAIFQDELGRSWLAEILYGHPAPTERGWFACRFRCPEDEAEPARLGYVTIDDLRAGDEEALREALEEAEAAREVG